MEKDSADKNKNGFLNYLKNLNLPSYSYYIQNHVLNDNMINKIYKIAKINLYEINDNNALNNLRQILNNNNEWLEYNQFHSHGIPNALINTHYRNYINNRKYNNQKAIMIDNLFEEKNNTQVISQESIRTRIPLNQILYGPPGTGKTYNTIIKTLEIINDKKYTDNDDNLLKEYKYSDLITEFNELKQTGQIELITFHQSYSYEEFVEGIKPDINSDDLKYIKSKGIFRRICDFAKELKNETVQYKFDYDNLSIYKILIPDDNLFNYCIENNCVAMNWGDNTDFKNCNTQEDIEKKVSDTEHRKQCISQMNIFKISIDNDLKNGKDVIAIIPGSLNTIKGIAKITGEYRCNDEIEKGAQQREVEWIKTDINISAEYIYSAKFVSPTITTMAKEKINENNLMKLLNTKAKSKKAVLIIDEINRGNISKIFGELITLIEEDKREKIIEDNKEYYTISVTLPYSHDNFTVPNNLYIIGTMNTADKSLALLDVALRRRFNFIPMYPRYNVIPDENKKQLLKNLNKKIYEKKRNNPDYLIGHSYFMNNDSIEEILKNKVVPLLYEYFNCNINDINEVLENANYKIESSIEEPFKLVKTESNN